MSRQLSDADRGKKERRRIEDQAFYGLLNQGQPESALIFARGISDEKQKAEYINKIETGADKTNPSTFAEINELIRSKDYDVAEDMTNEARLNGLSNAHADKLLSDIDKNRQF